MIRDIKNGANLHMKLNDRVLKVKVAVITGARHR